MGGAAAAWMALVLRPLFFSMTALQEKHYRDLLQSLQRGQKIQQAMLPDRQVLQQALSESFVCYHPKDLLSGDFYWWRRLGDRLLITLGDCTGHGVPGAMLSMMAFSMLEQLCHDCSPAEFSAERMLSQLNRSMLGVCSHGEHQIPESVDMSLCILDLSTRRLQYAGAYRPLYIGRAGELLEISADRYSIGGSSHYLPRDRSYTLHELQLQPQDCCYMFSDGYLDQFGQSDKKYSRRRFRELLLRIHALPAHEQLLRVEQEFWEWKGDQPQIDDVTVLGFRL